jgi:formylglycine-generating enzyme required for sulfatase activity
MTLRRLLAVAALVSHWPGGDAQAILPREAVALHVEIVVNAVDGPRSACEAAQEIQPHWRHESFVTIGEVRPRADSDAETGLGTRGSAEWEGLDGRIRCTDESPGQSPAASGGGSSHPYLLAKVATTALLVRKMEDEKVLVVKLSVSLRKLSGFGSGGEPIYEQTSVERQLYFPEPGDAFVPILIAGDREEPALGIREGFVRLAARSVRKQVGAAYGVLWVTSELEEAELFLDGGSVGRISPSVPVTLPNVLVGERELAARDASGRELRTVVTVAANRTSLVHFAPPVSDHAAHFRLEPLGTNAQGYETYRRGADGAVVVKIPAGEFLMGNRETERSPLEHLVYVSEFLMDETGVTWGQFKQFAEAAGIPLPLHEPYWGVHDDHPMVFVSWEEARAYCGWAGGRLPTEAEREKAARGTDERMYPWGNEDPDPERAVFRRSWGKEATAAVGTHPTGASPYGLQDMGGNVWEWCADWYDGDYYETSPYRDPKGPPIGNARVARGGSWDSRPAALSSSCRNWGHRGYRDGDFGFRCAMNAPR